MDPLSITASITTIVAAAAQVSNILTKVRDAPTSVNALMAEVTHVRIIFSSLEVYLQHAQTVTHHRAALIQIEDILVVLTQVALVFTEVQKLIEPLWIKSIKWKQRLIWLRKEALIHRLVDQLQRHKTSLSLLLQIIQW